VTDVERGSRYTSIIGLVRLSRGGGGLEGPSAAGEPPTVRRQQRGTMISLRPAYIWREDLSEQVHPKFVSGHNGWLLAIALLFVLLGLHHAWDTFRTFQPIVRGIRPGYDGLILSALGGEILVTLSTLLPGVFLLLTWKYSLAAARITLFLSPVAVFVTRVIIDPFDQSWWTGFTQFFLSGFLILSLPVLLYLHYSKRARNTFMFYGNKLPATISCPFCLTKQTPSIDQRQAKELVCSSCGHTISRSTVAA
jgi:hypothetical protein